MSEKYVYKKRFHDLENEESWLNEMCAGGLVLKKIEWGVLVDKYTFELCGKKYVCRIDYNPEMEVLDEITSPYVMFVTGTYEAEFICCANGKLYFHKAADKGDFPPIYTSLDSRIVVEKKLFGRYVLLSLVFILNEIYVMYSIYGVQMLDKGFTISELCFLLAGLANITPVVYCLARAFNHRKKISELKKR